MKADNCRYSEPPSEEGEIWKDIKDFEGYYKISNYGRVWSVSRKCRGQTIGGHLMHPSKDKRNRYTLALSKRGKVRSAVLARYVATAFIPIPEGLSDYEVNHLDENPANNRADNLEWCTHKYNCNYGSRVGRIKAKQNIPILQYTLDGKFVSMYPSMHIAATAIKADAGHICDCCLGNRKWAYGYLWRYKDNALYEKAKKTLADKIEKGKQSRRDKFSMKALNVVQLELDGTYIRTFKSSRLAAESVNSYRPMIINCCNGKCKQVKGYKWMYERDYQKLFINTEEERKAGMQLTFF